MNYNSYYTASHTRNSRGGDALPGFHISVEVESLRTDYTLPDGILPYGLHAGVSLVLPTFNTDLYTRTPAPRAVGRKVATDGLGDIVIVPLDLGFVGSSAVLGRYGAKFKMNIVTPSGDYNPTAFINKGRNQTSLQPQIGVQVFPRPDVSLGATLTYSYNYKNPANNYLSGQEFIVEPVAEYSPYPGLWVGAQGYAYRQLTRDELNGREFQDGHFGSALAIGPQIRYGSTALHGL